MNSVKLIRNVEKRNGYRRYAEFMCHCGVVFVTCTDDVNRGKTKSCGCSRKLVNLKHGHTSKGKPSTEYRTWQSMKNRCENVNDPAFDRYGGNGITVCEEWSSSFESFLNDMGKKPTTKHSIDRIDNSNGYCKENCRWATKKEQAVNRGTSRLMSAHGVTQCIADWAKTLEVPAHRISGRLSNGWSDHDALFLKKGEKPRTKK